MNVSEYIKEHTLDEVDERFVDSTNLINIDAGTCLGLEVFKIQIMIDFFRKEDYNPYEWDKFEEELTRIKCH